MEAIEQPTPEQLARRKAARERKQRQRSKEKTRSDRAMQAHREMLRAEQIYAEDIARRTRKNMVTLGEVSPGVNAATVEEALLIAREFARALTIPDIQEHESLLDFERRIFSAWIGYDKFVGRYDAASGGHAPYLNRATGELYPGFGRDYWIERGGFNKCWSSLPGAKEKIDIATLSNLKELKKVEEAKPEPTPPPSTPAPVPHQQPDFVAFSWLQPGARRFLNGECR